jgi:peptide/nickel transport system permease protein
MHRRNGRIGWQALTIVLGTIFVLAAIVPWLPLPDPGQQNLGERLRPPVWQDGGDVTHLLGTDHLGRDMAARLLYGARLTFFITLVGVLFSASLGGVLGILAGYHRGWLDAVISRLIDAQLALPFMLLAISIIAGSGRSIFIVIFVLATHGWAHYARILRGETLALRERPFVLGLRAAGVSSSRIAFRHILPNIGATFFVVATLEMRAMILGEGALSFLGLGVVAPQISWGLMLAEGRSHMVNAWWMVALTGLAMSFVVLSVNLLGDKLRSAYDPRLQRYGYGK